MLLKFKEFFMSDFANQALELLRKCVEEKHNGSMKDAAAFYDLNYQTVRSWLLGNRNPSITKLTPFLDKVDARIIAGNTSTIQRMGEHSPIEVVEGDNLVRVPVCAFSGAGNAVLYDDLEALHDIFIPKSYAYNEIKTLQILGDSMEPTIKDGAYIGVIKETELHIGKIYLVHQPPFGLVTKRIYQNENREIVLRSDNKEYVDITVPYEDYNDIIVGRVVWVLQHI